jgi:biotin carboxyl carrier protein
MKYLATIGEHAFEIEIEERGRILVNGQPHSADLQEIVPGRLFSLLLDNVSHQAFVEHDRLSLLKVLLRGRLFQVEVEDERAIRLARGLAEFVPDSGEIPIKAPMPGLVASIPVTAGQPVKKGDVLVILESMKMDNELTAPRAGSVARIHVAPGDSVDGQQTLVTLV